MTRPHALSPSPDTARVLIAYKNFAAPIGISHIGLGVSAMNTSQVLRSAGVWADVMTATSAAQLEQRIDATIDDALKMGQTQLSHVLVSAPWIPTNEWTRIVSKYPNISFGCISHSNVAFLHADANGVRLLREYIGLQHQWHNFVVGGNSSKFCEWAHRAYGSRLTFLPNLYNLGHTDSRTMRTRPPYKCGTLRVGNFGAMRILKNNMTAAAAALEVHGRLGCDTELWLSSGRAKGNESVVKAIDQLTQGVKGFTVKYNTWETWSQFTATVRHMNILLQPSFTESFNMVTADGVSQGVPSVVSDAIEWAPQNWQASADDALDIANKAIALLHDPSAACEGWQALQMHNELGLRNWKGWLKI